MSKLFKLKEWVTVPEAATHLAIICGEDVCEADVLRLALDGHLKLSVNIVNNTDAKEYKIQTAEEIEKIIRDIGESIKKTKKQRELIDDAADKVISLICDKNIAPEKVSDCTITIRGIYDLAMIGNEGIKVEDKYQELISGIDLDLVCIDGTFISNPDTLKLYQLQERWDDDVIADMKVRYKNFTREDMFYPSVRLPDDSFLVVRTAALREFERLLNETNKVVVDHEVKKETKTDALAVEIDCIIKQGTPAKSEYVWKELIARCNPEGNVCLRTEETDKGLVICWRGTGAKINRLNKKALTARLRVK